MNLLPFFNRKKAGSGMDRSPWGSFWFSSLGMGTASGVSINSNNAMMLGGVFRAVSLVSGHMGMLPIRFYEAGTHKRIKNHPIQRLLSTNPNPYQNAFEWREMLQGHLELRGNAYNQIVSDNKGAIKALVPIHPDRVKVTLLDNGDVSYTVQMLDGTLQPFSRSNIWHIRELSSDGYVGLSRIQYARESLGLSLSAQSYGSRFFANDARPSSGWIEQQNVFKDEQSREVFTEQVQRYNSGSNRGRIMVLEAGMKFHEVGLSNDDAQFLETRKFQVEEIARWFGIPPHKIGSLEKATFSNIEQQALEYVQDALQPRATRWENAIQSSLLFDDEEIDVRFDFHELLRGDAASRGAYYHNAILDGWMTRNEAREMEGMEPIEGLDKPLVAVNMAILDTNGNVQQVASDADQEPATGGLDESEDSTAKRFDDILRAGATRMARRIAKEKTVNIEIFSKSMGLTDEESKNFIYDDSQSEFELSTEIYEFAKKGKK